MDGRASKCDVFTEMVMDGRASKGNIFTEKSPIERLPRAMYLQKWLQMERHIYRKVADGKASKHDIFTERGQGGIGCPLTSTPPSRE